MKLTADLKPVALPLPDDVDVSDLPYFPMFDGRLRKSRAWLKAKNWRDADHDVSGPGLAFVLMNLWFRAFHEIPAGSIEDDDDILADAAGVDIAYWRAVRPVVLDGWICISGRVWHPLISAIAWAVWRERLEVRFANARRAWHAQSKRRSDAGLPPGDAPPEAFADWVLEAYQQSAVYISMLASGCAPDAGGGQALRVVSDGVSDVCDAHNAGCDAHKDGCNSHTGPKRSIREESIPPVAPPRGAGLETSHAAKPQPATKDDAGTKWFRNEYGRLRRELGAFAMTLQAMVQKPGVSPQYTFVSVFKGAWLSRVEPGGMPALVLPSAARRNKFVADYSRALQTYLPDLSVRWQTVAEARQRRALAGKQTWRVLSRDVRDGSVEYA